MLNEKIGIPCSHIDTICTTILMDTPFYASLFYYCCFINMLSQILYLHSMNFVMKSFFLIHFFALQKYTHISSI